MAAQLRCRAGATPVLVRGPITRRSSPDGSAIELAGTTPGDTTPSLMPGPGSLIGCPGAERASRTAGSDTPILVGGSVVRPTSRTKAGARLAQSASSIVDGERRPARPSDASKNRGRAWRLPVHSTVGCCVALGLERKTAPCGAAADPGGGVATVAGRTWRGCRGTLRRCPSWPASR